MQQPAMQQVGEFRARAFLKGMHRVCALVDEANRSLLASSLQSARRGPGGD